MELCQIECLINVVSLWNKFSINISSFCILENSSGYYNLI